MQNADREAVKPTTASAALNNSHRATAAKNASMGLGVSSSGGGDIGSSSESSDPRVGRFQRRNLGDDRSDGEAERSDALWKVMSPLFGCDVFFKNKNWIIYGRAKRFQRRTLSVSVVRR